MWPAAKECSNPHAACSRCMTLTTKAIFFPLIKLMKQVLQDVLISVSRWLPPPWHGGGLPGSTWDVPGCAADAWVCSGWFYCRRALALGVAVVWVLHGGIFPGWRYPPGVILACGLQGRWVSGLCPAQEKAGSGLLPRQGPAASWDPGHSIVQLRAAAPLTG